MIVEPRHFIVESIPLPFASVTFSDGYHAALLKNLGVDAAVVLFARPNRSYYIASAIGFPNAKLDQDFSDLCDLVVGNSLAINGEIIPVTSSFFKFPALKEHVDTYGYQYFRLYKVNDFLSVNGYWIMFFRSLSQAHAIGPVIQKSISSPQFRDAISETVAKALRTEEIDDVIQSWVRLLDKRDKETEAHTERVAHLSVCLARKMGLPVDEVEDIHRGALLHDIGKIVIPNEILLKPGKLSETEWKIMRLHPKIVTGLLSSFSMPDRVLEIPLHHHEKWDGSGYPKGLSGEEIPLSARIFAVVDVWDALISDRPYRPKFPKEQVYTMMQNEGGSHFDPEVLHHFMEMLLGDSAQEI